MNPNIRRVITVGLWIIATGILVVYSFVVKSKSPSSPNLGFLIMVALLTTDVLVYLIQHAEIVSTATPMAMILFLNRFFLIIFGSQNWIYGYILIYVCYGVLLCTIIAKRRFPFEDDVKKFDIDEMAARLKVKREGGAI